VVRLIQTSPGLLWCVDHGNRTMWRVPSGEVLNWLKAQGIPEVSGLQPAAYLAGYREIAAS
jgi:hypothetical protein